MLFTSSGGTTPVAWRSPCALSNFHIPISVTWSEFRPKSHQPQLGQNCKMNTINHSPK